MIGSTKPIPGMGAPGIEAGVQVPGSTHVSARFPSEQDFQGASVSQMPCG